MFCKYNLLHFSHLKIGNGRFDESVLLLVFQLNCRLLVRHKVRGYKITTTRITIIARLYVFNVVFS